MDTRNKIPFFLLVYLFWTKRLETTKAVRLRHPVLVVFAHCEDVSNPCLEEDVAHVHIEKKINFIQPLHLYSVSQILSENMKKKTKISSFFYRSLPEKGWIVLNHEWGHQITRFFKSSFSFAMIKSTKSR